MNTITNSLWSIVSKLIPTKKTKVGRPEYNARKTFEAIHHILREGGRWSSLEKIGYGKRSTIHGKFKKWCNHGIFKKIADTIGSYYRSTREIDYKWYAIDTTSKPAPFLKTSGKNPTDRKKRGVKYVIAADREGAPLYVDIAPANKHDSQLIHSILEQLSDMEKLQIVAGDSAFDSKKLRKKAASLNITLISSINPRKDKSKRATHVLHRWIIEQTFGILMQNRGLRHCYFKLNSTLIGMLQLACSIRVFSMW